MKYLMIALISIAFALTAQPGQSCTGCSGGGCGSPGPGLSCAGSISVTPRDAGIDICSVVEDRDSAEMMVRYSLEENASVTMGLHSMEGEALMLLTDGFYEAGNHTVSFQTDSLDPGMYVIELTALEAKASAVIYVLGQF